MEGADGNSLGWFSYACLAIGIPKLADTGLDDQTMGALQLALFAHEYVHYLHFAGTSYGVSVSSARLVTMGDAIPELKRRIAWDDGQLRIPVWHADGGFEAYAFKLVFAACAAWTAAAWSNTDLQSEHLTTLEDFAGGVTPFRFALEERGWKLPRGQSCPSLAVGPHAVRITPRTLTESAAYSVQKRFVPETDDSAMADRLKVLIGTDSSQPSDYLLLERLRRYEQFDLLTSLAAIELAWCPPIDATGRIVHQQISAWEDLYPPWRFVRIVDHIRATQKFVTNESAAGAWRDCICTELGWPSFVEVRDAVLHSLRDNLLERRMRSIWTSHHRDRPLGLDPLRWLLGDRRLSRSPIFLQTDGIRRTMAEGREVAEAYLIAQSLNLFDHLTGHGRSRKHFTCAPVGWDIPCSKRTQACGRFPGFSPDGCPEVAFFRANLAITPEAVVFRSEGEYEP